VPFYGGRRLDGGILGPLYSERMVLPHAVFYLSLGHVGVSVLQTFQRSTTSPFAAELHSMRLKRIAVEVIDLSCRARQYRSPQFRPSRHQGLGLVFKPSPARAISAEISEKMRHIPKRSLFRPV